MKLLLLAVVGGGGTLYYFWQQATKLPSEYVEAIATHQTDSQSLPAKPIQIKEQITVSKSKIVTPIDRAKIGQKVAVKLNDRDLNNLVVDRLAASQKNRQIPAGIKGITTNIKDGMIHTGALVNLGELAKDGQPGSQTAALSKLTDGLPFLKDRDVYIGIVGKPVVTGNKIKFDEDSQIKVGSMNFTIAQIAENLGVSQEKIQQAIDLKLQQQNLQVDRVAPVNIYGVQKLAAEREILAIYPQATIGRMPLMFGLAPNTATSFIQPWLKSLRMGQNLQLFVDEFRTPVSAITAAKGLLLALEKSPGIIHLGGRERISRYEFGRLLAQVFNFDLSLLHPIQQQDLQMLAPRAADVSLDSTKAIQLGYEIPELKTELASIYQLFNRK